jgi:undecaprenyl-diphosphatase
MDWITSLFFGFLQGATEFLPISSSGHLVLAHRVFGVEEVGLAFDVALHLGTLVGLVIYFRNDFLHMARSLLNRNLDEEGIFSRNLFIYICIATLPAVLAGVVFGSEAETSWRSPILVAFTLAGVGLLLLIADKKGKCSRKFTALTVKDILLIGLAQALAIVPGVSRSGITIIAGLFLGLERAAAARFSFLLSAPVILGAGIYNLPTIFRQGLEGGMLVSYLTGFIMAAVSGYCFIAFLLKYVRTRSLAVFAYYRFGLAALVLLLI